MYIVESSKKYNEWQVNAYDYIEISNSIRE